MISTRHILICNGCYVKMMSEDVFAKFFLLPQSEDTLSALLKKAKSRGWKIEGENLHYCLNCKPQKE